MKYVLLFTLLPFSVWASLDVVECHGLVRKNRALAVEVMRLEGDASLSARLVDFNPKKPNTVESRFEGIKWRRLGQHRVQYVSEDGHFNLDVDLFPDFEPRKNTWPYMARFGSATLSCIFPKGN
jgi:hypothetical protein